MSPLWLANVSSSVGALGRSTGLTSQALVHWAVQSSTLPLPLPCETDFELAALLAPPVEVDAGVGVLGGELVSDVKKTFDPFEVMPLKPTSGPARPRSDGAVDAHVEVGRGGELRRAGFERPLVAERIRRRPIRM